jgi:hypothetical protein
MIKCKQIDIFRLIREHKSHFEIKSIGFFKLHIDPVFNANNKRKLKLAYDSNSMYITAGAIPEQVLKYNYSFNDEYMFGSEVKSSGSYMSRIDIIKEASNFIGGGQFYQQAFLYYLSTSLNLFTKYFNVKDLKGWFFHSGINDAQKKNTFLMHDELIVFDKSAYSSPADFTHYTRPWYQIIKSGGFTGHEQIFIDSICDTLKVRSIYELISDGYMDYRSSIEPEQINLPKVISNKMDFELWKIAISKIKICQKNIKNIMYASNYVVQWEYGDLMRQHIMNTYPLVAKRQYFLN